MDDNGAAEDALRANQLDLLISNATGGVPLTVGLEVSKVANMAFAI